MRVIVDWLNRQRYAFINGIDRVLCRWEYRIDMRREREATNRAQYIGIAAANWRRWGSWSYSEVMRRWYVA